MSALTALEVRALLRVERSDFHACTRARLSSDLRAAADALVARGLLRVLPRKGRFPRRYVVTSAGSWALGTFDFDTLHEERRTARKAA